MSPVPPDRTAPLAEQEAWLRTELDTDPLWRDIDLVAQTGSTNADLAARAAAGAPQGAVLVANSQTAGRGRLNRTWTAPPGSSMAFSVLLRPTSDVTAWSWLPLLTGIAMCTALRSSTGVQATLKWPNDVLIDDRKVAGILTELVGSPDGPACVVGCGLNTLMTPDQLPVPTATSLGIEGAFTDQQVTPVVLLAAILREFSVLFCQWEAGSGPGPVGRYLDLCSTIGRQVTVSLTDGTQLVGQATGIDPAGRLEVRTDAGLRTVAAGDVVHARPRDPGPAASPVAQH